MISRLHGLIGLWLWALVFSVQGANVYRCTGPDGVLMFGDNKVPGSQCALVLGAGDPIPKEGADSRLASSSGASPWSNAGSQAYTTPASHDVINDRYNLFEFRDRSVFARFHKKWKAAPKETISIAHFGDSHLQNGFAIEAARTKLQDLVGDAGRGMMFPYAVAKSYSPNEYATTFTGHWDSANSIQTIPKIPLGVTGFVARTSETPASFAFRFKTTLGSGAKRVRVFVRSSAPGFRLIATSGPTSLSAQLDQAQQSGQQAVEFEFPELAARLRFDLVNLGQQRASFELHGVSIENRFPGLVYHNLGVGGSTFGALNSQTYFEEQMAQLHPDLFILDWGTNDIVYRNAVPDNLRETVVRAIQRIRQFQPQSVIVLTSVQDMNYRGHPISAAREFSETMKSIAFEQGCLFYDWFRIAGGANSMTAWVNQGLASKDNVHLSVKGYRLKGELFAKALLNTIDFYSTNRNNSGLVVANMPATDGHATLERRRPTPK